MKGFSIILESNYGYTLLDSYIMSKNNDIIKLYSSSADRKEWGYVGNIISINDCSNVPILLNLNIKDKSGNTQNITIKVFPSYIKECLSVGISHTRDVVLWDYAEKKSLIHKYIPSNKSNQIIDNWMKQFTYRYQVVFEQWDEEEKWNKYEEEKEDVIPEFDYIEEMLFDGTYDKLHDGGLMKYHEAGKPKKLALKWHIKKSDYAAYFWFEDEEICAIFNKFYGQHPDSKTDLIIHIDPIKKKYELSLYRYGMKEPVIISKNAYQLIVFKSGFENYRSDNYNQESGAWIW